MLTEILSTNNDILDVSLLHVERLFISDDSALLEVLLRRPSLKLPSLSSLCLLYEGRVHSFDAMSKWNKLISLIETAEYPRIEALLIRGYGPRHQNHFYPAVSYSPLVELLSRKMPRLKHLGVHLSPQNPSCVVDNLDLALLPELETFCIVVTCSYFVAFFLIHTNLTVPGGL
jgi:hypothetical protein